MRKIVLASFIVLVLGYLVYRVATFNLLGDPVRQDLAMIEIPSTNCRAVVTSVLSGATAPDYIQIAKECDGRRIVIARIMGFDSVGFVRLKGDSLLVEAMFTSPSTGGRTVCAVKIR